MGAALPATVVALGSATDRARSRTQADWPRSGDDRSDRNRSSSANSAHVFPPIAWKVPGQCRTYRHVTQGFHWNRSWHIKIKASTYIFLSVTAARARDLLPQSGKSSPPISGVTTSASFSASPSEFRCIFTERMSLPSDLISVAR
jgi:hypothetical protein